MKRRIIKHPIYIGTIALEKNRWKPGKIPTYQVSNWMKKFKNHGFDGIELWENHYLKANPEEQYVLEKENNIAIFNCYCDMSDEHEKYRNQIATASKKLNAKAIKYNIGHNKDKEQEYIKNLKSWKNKLAPNIKLLCECHPGTIIEKPGDAMKFFNKFNPMFSDIIVHPFLIDSNLNEWLDIFDQRVSHAHLQMRSDEKIVLYEKRKDIFNAAIEILQKYDYSGSFTLEFTEGVGEKVESPQSLFDNILSDLSFLTERLSYL